MVIKFISKITTGILKHIIISSFAYDDLGFTNTGDAYEGQDFKLDFANNILFCQIKQNICENEKKIVRILFDAGCNKFIFVGKGQSREKLDINGFVITGHVNMSGNNPLRGVNVDKYGVRFPDMSDTYTNNFPTEILSKLKLKQAKLLIPANINNLSELEKQVLAKDSELKVLSEETYYGVITSKHAQCKSVSIILVKRIKINSLFI